MSDDLTGFVQSTLRSVWALELLLLMRRRADEVWTADRLVREMRASAALVGPILDDLTNAGIIAQTEPGQYQYQPASDVVRNCCEALAQLHQERPLSVMRMITTAPRSSVQTFADAFRFKDK